MPGSWGGISIAAAVPETPLPLTEDFEDTDYITNINGTWGRSSVRAHTGSWSFKSPVTNHGAQSFTEFAVPAGAVSLQFWFWIETEEDFDLFTLYVDGVFRAQASGMSVAWAQSSVQDVTGSSVVKFGYERDPAAGTGANACWIDDVTFS